jgi:hypothetical protein
MDSFERNFETPSISCKVFEDQRMGCYNISSIDLALSLIRLKIAEDVYLNITLYDLQASYDDVSKLTMFFIKFVEDENELQVGEALFKNYYISIDMKGKRLLYSPINRFPSTFSTIYVIRFFVGFGIFTIFAAVIAFIWQKFTDPFEKTKGSYEQ